MRLPIPDLDPVAIALDRVESSGDLRFSGIDLESGARVSISIDRRPQDAAVDASTLDAHGLVLVLSLETLPKRQ